MATTPKIAGTRRSTSPNGHGKFQNVNCAAALEARKILADAGLRREVLRLAAWLHWDEVKAALAHRAEILTAGTPRSTGSDN